MVMNKRDLEKIFSPNKKRNSKRKSIEANKSTKGGGISGNRLTVTSSSNNVNQNNGQKNIKVIVRVRPQNERESQENYHRVVQVVDDKMLIFDPKKEENQFFYHGREQKTRDLLKKQNKELQFMFDQIFNEYSTNDQVFDGTTKEMIIELLDGYNCSVFAYGATGAGKTHTMLGKESDPGITFKTVAELFRQMEEQSGEKEFNLGVSYLEIYNENVQDLLHKTGPLALREDSKAGVVVADLKIISIKSPEELLILLNQGNRNRTQHPTDANAESSRSHAVFQVYINITNKLDGQIKRVKLSMIDLAGSERASATGCKGERFKEGANINKSLLALGNCINNLAEGIKHIPYRDSKLTRLLKDSLGGNCRTVMIANIGPSSLSYEDTYNTLRYANRAKKIKTNMKKNIVSFEMHVTGYIKLVDELKKENSLLKAKIAELEKINVNKTNVPATIVTEVQSESTKNDIKNFSDRLTELLDKKKYLNNKILQIQSSDKIFCCRIQHKIAADKRLHNLTAAVNLVSSEQNSSGKLRVNKSLSHFKRQRDILKAEMEVYWSELKDIERELVTIDHEIKSKNLSDKLSNIYNDYKNKIDVLRVQHQYDHARKLCNLEQCEKESVEKTNRMLSVTLQKYYKLMLGYGTLTDKMKEEFKQLVKSLEGVKNIKWADAVDIGTSQDSYNLTCLSIDVLEDPLRKEMPIHLAAYLEAAEEEPESTLSVSNTVASTSITAEETSTAVGLETVSECIEEEESINSSENVSEILNSTITLSTSDNLEDNNVSNVAVDDDNDDDYTDESEPTSEVIPPKQLNVEQLNNTFNLLEKKKAKKRVLPEQSACKIPPKQSCKTGSVTKSLKTVSVQPNLNGKENKTIVKPPGIKMSAKSIAILNKLKTERMKTLSHASTVPKAATTLKAPSTSLVSSTPLDKINNSKFKVVRPKERRALNNSHPYQKKSTVPTTTPSIRRV